MFYPLSYGAVQGLPVWSTRQTLGQKNLGQMGFGQKGFGQKGVGQKGFVRPFQSNVMVRPFPAQVQPQLPPKCG